MIQRESHFSARQPSFQIKRRAALQRTNVPNVPTARPQQNLQVTGGLAPSGGGSGTAPVVSSGAITGGSPGVSIVAKRGGMVGAFGANGGGECAARSGVDEGGLRGASLGATAGTALCSGRMDQRLKEFKIHSGTIGGENQLSMDDLIIKLMKVRPWAMG